MEESNIDVSAIVSEVIGYGETALLAAITLGTALLAWRLIKRFLRAV